MLQLVQKAVRRWDGRCRAHRAKEAAQHTAAGFLEIKQKHGKKCEWEKTTGEAKETPRAGPQEESRLWAAPAALRCVEGAL